MTYRTPSALVLLGLTTLSLAAQPPAERSPFEANLTSVIAMADAKKLSSRSNPAGYLLGLAYRAELYPSMEARLHLGFMSFAGKDGSGLENKKRPQLHFGLDLMKAYERFTFYGGLTGTQWKQSINASDPDFTGFNRATGIKLGARAGAEYLIGRGLTAQLSFEQTEFNRKFNPSWIGAGIVYRFKGE